MKSQRMVSLALTLMMMSIKSEKFNKVDEVDKIEFGMLVVKTKICQVPENQKIG